MSKRPNKEPGDPPDVRSKRTKADTVVPPEAEVQPEAEAQTDEQDEAGDGLTAAQAKAVEALLAEPTLARAATIAGVSGRTLRRWMQTPVFRNAVLTARRESFGQAIGLTQKYAPVAVATLVKVMQDSSGGPSAKVSAAAMMLKFGREGIELDDLAARVEALEQAAALPSPTPEPKSQEDDE